MNRNFITSYGPGSGIIFGINHFSLKLVLITLNITDYVPITHNRNCKDESWLLLWLPIKDKSGPAFEGTLMNELLTNFSKYDEFTDIYNHYELS